VGSSTFKKLWLQLVPNIVVARPRTDLCSVCQVNMTSVYRSVNLTEDQKSERVKKLEQHLLQVQKEVSVDYCFS
jgi:hypothetical protein